MRYLSFVFCLLAGVASALPETDTLRHHESASLLLRSYGFQGDSISPDWFSRRSIVPRAAAPKSLVPAVQAQPAQYTKGALRKKIRYGPMRLPSTKEKNWQADKLDDSGMSDTMSLKIAQPCTDCTILFAKAGLEYANGNDANINTGSWLHHIVLMNNGPGRRDAACNFSGTDPFFSSGNERTLTSFTNPEGTFKTGYYVKRSDSFSLYSELMNLDIAEKYVWVTLTYEYLPNRRLDYLDTRAVWLGIGQCLKPPVPSGKPGPSPIDKLGRPLSTKPFDINSPAWYAPWNGIKLSVGGHLHDGGTNIFIYENQHLLCDSKAGYGTSSEYTERSTGIQGTPGMRHISRMSGCSMMGPLKKGTRYYLTARYNFDKHPTMRNNKGKPDEIMGISLLYIAVHPGVI